MQQKKIGFIGGGNMTKAIVSGLVKQGYPVQYITVCDRNQPKRHAFEMLGVHTSQDSLNTARNAEVIVLAVKPQAMAETCALLSKQDLSQKQIISVAAGIKIDRLQTYLPTAKQIIRVMPNTPALLLTGMSGLYPNANTTSAFKQFCADMFASIGKICWLEQEEDINLVIAGSGSSPAYFFLFMEAMYHFLLEKGVEATTARLLIEQSAFGAAKMVQDNPTLTLAELRQQVTSKGGTTAAAINVFEQAQLSTITANAMQAAIDRATEMEKLF
ncbi:pyrroline-5-carboxylate reductase [Mergibacter septicus]|uniref:pyrroline-5-carboxylate reductase n=1 Tax=Mergibacter septicus TaxID=221402 RepID=UPI001C778F04|nr:pyrroline-5-carboxylate reductase [Mergibacter septicus]QDJ13613.1 pyrroline-5-carboxylate reductase [Mergibacter septicus]